MMKTHRLAALAAVLIVGGVAPAKAVQVTYTTSGVFGQSGSPVAVLAEGGVTVSYVPTTQNYDPNPTSFANFGSFTVTGTPNASAQYSSPVVDTFTLTITQAVPTPTGGNPATFTSTVNGTITFNPQGIGSSQAFVTFTTLSQTINGSPNVLYEILEGDADNSGRVELTIGALSSIDGSVTVTQIEQVAPVPEPGTMALAGIALPLLGLGYARHRRRNA